MRIYFYFCIKTSALAQFFLRGEAIRHFTNWCNFCVVFALVYVKYLTAHCFSIRTVFIYVININASLVAFSLYCISEKRGYFCYPL